MADRSSSDNGFQFAELLRDATTYGISQFVSKGLIFGLLPVYTYFLTPEQYGLVSLAQTLGLFVGFLSNGALPGALQRLYFKYDQDHERRRFISTVLNAGIVWALLIALLTVLAGKGLFSWVFPDFIVPFSPFLALGVGIGIGREFQNYRLNLYQVRNQPRHYAAFQIGTGLLVAALSLYFVVARRSGAAGLLLGHCLAYGTAGLVAIWTFRRWLDQQGSSEMLGRSLRFGLPLVAQQFIAQVLVGADRFFLERFASLQAVGSYSMAYQLGMTITLINAALILAWKPDFFEFAEQGGKRQRLADTSLRLMALLTGFAIVGFLVSEGFVYLVLDETYSSAGLLTPLIILGHLFNCFYVFFHLAIYHSERTWLIPLVTVIAAGTNIALNYVLVPQFGPAGAAWATVAAFLLEAVTVYAAAQWTYALPYRKVRLLGIGFIAGIVCLFSQYPGSFTERLMWLVPSAIFGLGAIWGLSRFPGRQDDEVA